MAGDGANAVKSNQATVATTVTAIVPERSGRKSVTIIQHGTTDVFLGAAAVTTSDGALLTGTKGAQVKIDGGGAVFGIVAAGTQVVSYIESF